MECNQYGQPTVHKFRVKRLLLKNKACVKKKYKNNTNLSTVGVQNHTGDKTCHLKDKVNEDSKRSDDSKAANSRHSNDRAKTKRYSFTDGAKQNAWPHFTQCLGSPFFNRFVDVSILLSSFELMTENEDIVHTDSQNQEGNDLSNDQGDLLASERKDTNGGHD